MALTGDIPRAGQDLILEGAKHEKLVICATVVAEDSLTIP